ncbi:hypothetical protein VPH35_098262 [Triticum aestivum]
MATQVVRLAALPVEVEGKKDEKVVRWLKHYSSAQRILIVGDGDFSFSRALVTAFGSGANLVATSLDSYGALICKHHQAESNVRELKRMGATVLHDVDMKRFDRIVFNFPHAGFIGQETQLHVINSHKELVRVFFRSASNLLCPDGEVHVSHKTGQPYDRWDISSNWPLNIHLLYYPGYNQKKGDGRKCNRSFPLRNGCTFKFRMERKESEDESAMYCLVAAMAKMSMARAHDDVTM